MRKLFLILILGSRCFMCYSTSHSTSLDSIYSLSYYEVSAEKSARHVSSFKNLCKSDSDFLQLFDLYFLIGYKYRHEGELSLAYSYYERAASIAEKFNDQDRLRDTYVNRAKLLYQTGKYKDANEFSSLALEIAIKQGNELLQANFHFDIGVQSRLAKDMEKAIENFEKALVLYKELRLNEKVALVYNELGVIGFKLGETQGALDYYSRAIAACDTSKYILSIVNNNRSLIYSQTQDTLKAIDMLQESIQLVDEEKELIARYNLLGEIFYHQNKLDTALKLFISAVLLNDFSGDHGIRPDEMYTSLNYLEKIQKDVNDPYLLVDSGVQSKITEFTMWLLGNNIELSSAVERLRYRQAVKEIEAKEEIKQLKENSINIAIVSAIIIALILFVLSWLNYKKSKMLSYKN